jgi:hypothetical protein
MAEVGAFNEAVTKEVTGWDTVTSSNVQLAIGKRADKYVSPTRPTRAADQAFWGIGLSSMSVYSMLTPDDPNRDPNVGGSGGAWWWHSEHETIDKFDPEILAQDTRLYATIMLRLATAKVLPFCPSAIAQDFLDALREYDEAAGSLLNFKAVIAEAKALKTAMHVLEAQASNLSSPRATDAMNRQMLLLTRILNPALYQVGTSFSHDPALGSRALPSLGASLDLSALDPASDTARFAVVGLMRRLNQVTHQIREARKLVDEVIG